MLEVEKMEDFKCSKCGKIIGTIICTKEREFTISSNGSHCMKAPIAKNFCHCKDCCE